MAIFKRKTPQQRDYERRDRNTSPQGLHTFWSDLRTFAFKILPAHYGSLILLALLWLILSNAVGDSLGLSNILRDRPDVQTQYYWGNLNSPTFWTSAITIFACCLVFVFPAFQTDLESSKGHVTFDQITRKHGRIFFLISSGLAYVALIWVWRRADASANVDYEYLRIGLGFVTGSGIFYFCLWLGKRLRNMVPAVIERWFGNRIQQAEAAAYTHLTQKSQLSAMPSGMLNARTRAQKVYFAVLRLKNEGSETLLRLAFILPMLAVISGAFFAGILIPVVALMALILGLFLAFKLLWVLPVSGRGLVLWGVLAAVIVPSVIDIFPDKTGRNVFKHAFTGIRDTGGADHYDKALDLSKLDEVPEACELENSASALSLQETLTAWHKRQVALHGDAKPKLVFIATSGGAYRASYWTTLVMDRLIQANAHPDLKGIADSVRLITGASGGMVGAAYFAALAGDRPKYASQADTTQTLSSDILLSQIRGEDRQRPDFYTTRYPVPRDSLSGVAQHLLQSDLRSIFTPGHEPNDRGRVLENHWQSLAVPMSAFAQGEREGWRPSLILSPMIVETGQQLLISNLDLGALPSIEHGEAVEMFDWFPCARDSFQLNTAVRMNATFPFISPAVSLPTTPKRRVVDAGYYDNYGVSLLNAVISQSSAQCARYDAKLQTGAGGPFCFREWVHKHTSGILLLEIRAFGLGTEGELGEACTPVPEVSGGGTLEFLTSPVEAVLAARSRAMVFQNEQGRRRISQLDTRFAIDRVVFAHCAEGSMNWIVPPDEFEDMRIAADSQWDLNIDRLTAAWNRR